jgi:hypothetical protein
MEFYEGDHVTFRDETYWYYPQYVQKLNQRTFVIDSMRGSRDVATCRLICTNGKPGKGIYLLRKRDLSMSSPVPVQSLEQYL